MPTRLAPVLALVLALALLAAACGDDGEADVGSPSDDGGGEPDGTRPSVAGEWLLVSATGDEIGPVPEPAPTMRIEQGEISGTSGCNQFGGTIDAADDGTLALSPLFMTEMACLDGDLMAFEAAYLRLLGSMDTWTVTPAGLTLSGPVGELGYEQAPPVEPEPLEGTAWGFDTIYAGEGPDRAATNSAEMDGVIMVIADGTATIDAPACPTLAMSVTHEDGSEGAFATPGDVDIPTSEGCAIVGELVAGLRASTGFTITGARLTLIGEPGETIGFSAAE